MKICGIYKIISPTKKVYIGQSVNITHRWYRYKELHCKGQPHLYNSLKKYGADKHKFEIICQCDKSELNNLEKYYIELYQCFDSEYGLNLKEGGNRKCVWSKKSREKASKSHIGIKQSKETIKKIKDTCNSTSFREKIKGRNGKIIIDTINNTTFCSIKEAAKSTGMNNRTLIAMLSGRNPNKTNFRYLIN